MAFPLPYIQPFFYFIHKYNFSFFLSLTLYFLHKYTFSFSLSLTLYFLHKYSFSFSLSLTLYFLHKYTFSFSLSLTLYFLHKYSFSFSLSLTPPTGGHSHHGRALSESSPNQDGRQTCACSPHPVGLHRDRRHGVRHGALGCGRGLRRRLQPGQCGSLGPPAPAGQQAYLSPVRYDAW